MAPRISLFLINIISPPWGVLSQGAGEAMQVCLPWLAQPRDKAWWALALPMVREHMGCRRRDGRVQAHWLQWLGQEVWGRSHVEI